MKKTLLLFIASAGLFLAASCGNMETKTEKTEEKSAVEMQEEKEERNKEIVKNMMQAFNSHSLDEAMKNTAPNFVDYGDGNMQPITNMDSLKAMFNGWITSFDMKADNLQYFADGDHVLVMGDWTGTWKQDYMGMKANGKSFQTKDMDIFKLNDEGQIVEHRNIQNWGLMMQTQLGMKMPM